ncbi:hypothetical protein INT47_004569 [Mucor saturninus]|uniref:Coth-domain-containing protein n=1 Tax=Mucor saturninus TaxID=64648 RepID=A0A8H7VAS4_9FUNG|nr:hypothetical protein INT47_004569 [Mucor saturninus]
MSVVVDDSVYHLYPNTTYPFLFSGKAPKAKVGYRYVKITDNPSNYLSESFLRSPQDNTNTLHEFFNRTWNRHPNVQLPKIYPLSISTNRLVSLLHKDDEIPTIHFSGNQTELDLMHHNPPTDPISVTTVVSYVSLEDAFQFNNVELSLAGRSSVMMPKLSYIFKLDKADSLYGYRRIKLRALVLDPSYIREQIGYDILSSSGAATTNFSYVRVFMNERELGLFGLIEAFQNPWLANEFNGGDIFYKNGYLYQGNSEDPYPGHTSDLAYYKDNLTAYADGQYKIKEEEKGGSKDDFQPLMDFTRSIAEAPVNTSDAVTIWNKAMDTEGFLRSMAIEVLGGYSDGYIVNANNFCIYQKLETNQYVYIPADLDLCLGNGLRNVSQLLYVNYTDFTGWGNRPLLNRILLIQDFYDRFLYLLQDLNNKLFNMEAVEPRINDLVDMIREDVEWDKTLPGIAQDTFDGLVHNLPPSFRNDPVLWDIVKRIISNITFNNAINDSKSQFVTYMSLKPWISRMHQNTNNFFSQNSS